MMNLQGFLEQYNEEPFEILDGKKINIIPKLPVQYYVEKSFFLALQPFDNKKHGMMFWGLPYLMMENSFTVRQAQTPHLMFIKQDRWQNYCQQYPNWQDLPLLCVPDIVIDVIAPTDLYSIVFSKIRKYLIDGVKLVWIADPFQKLLSIYQGDLKNRVDLEGDDWLTGGEILTDFKIQVSQIFKDIN